MFIKSQKSEKLFDFDDINFILLDECHSISGNKLYEILYDIKYNYKKHIIGFSATPLREKKGAENNLKQISANKKYC